MERKNITLWDLEVRELQDDDDVSKFSCGVDDLDEFLRDDAKAMRRKNMAVVYLAFYEEKLVGYVALLADAVILQSDERKKMELGHQGSPQVPAVKIGRLGTDAEFKASHRGVGTAMVHFGCLTALAVAKLVGCRLVTTDAKNVGEEPAVLFYEKLGFQRNKAVAKAKTKAAAATAAPAAGAAPPEATVAETPAEATVSMRLDIGRPDLPSWLTFAPPAPAPAAEGELSLRVASGKET